MKYIFLALTLVFLSSCGPKEIGGGTYEPPGERESTAELMRYPMTGSSQREQMLYYSNKPQVMERMQTLKRDWYMRKMGIQPSPEDPAYRAEPKQASPFRE